MYLTQKKFWPILFAVDVLGNIAFFWKRFKRSPDKKDIKKVLFIRLEHIGDMVMSTPVYETWKRNHPKCEVHVLCKTITEPVIRFNPNVDKIITFDPSWMLKRAEDKDRKEDELVSKLRKEDYDIIFEMHGDPRNNRLASRIAGRRSYTVGYGCRGLGFLLNKTAYYDMDKHMIDQNLDLIKDYCKKIYPQMHIYTDQKIVKKCADLMRKLGLKKDNFVIINPKSGRPEKDLTVNEVENFLKEYSRYKILITGSKGEREYNEQFVREHKSNKIMNICGDTDLLVLAELVKNAKIVIGPDTGIIHIAKCQGTQFKAVYKVTNVKVWGY